MMINVRNIADRVPLNASATVRNVAQTIAVAGLYFLAARLGLSLASVHANVSPVWPPTGIAIAAVLLLGYRVWPGILLGAFVANVLTPVTFAAAAGIAFGNTVEAICAGAVLSRLSFHESLDRARDVFKFVVVTAICTMLSATIGTASLCLSHAANWNDFGHLWRTWWLGDLTGAVTIAPLLLTWGAGRDKWFPKRRYIEGAALLILLSVAAIFTFGKASPTPVQYFPLTRLIVPFLLWAAFRLGRRGVTAAIAVTSAFAVWGTAQGGGPFLGGAASDSLLILQLFLGSNAVTFLFLGAVVEERRRSESSRRENEKRLAVNLAITRILAEVLTLRDATPRIARTVCESLRWELGAMWTPDEGQTVLKNVNVWRTSETRHADFERVCRAQTFAKGVGLPGRVWETLKPAWIANVSKADNFPRASSATAEDLHSAFAFPILLDDQFLGVMEFFGREIRKPDEELLATFAGIGSQIGQFVKRKRAEEALEPISLLPQENPAPVMRLEAGRIVTYANPAAERILAGWNLGLGREVPAQIVKIAGESLAADTKRESELPLGTETYLLNFVPVVEFNYVNLYFTDITNLKRSEKALAEAVRQQKAQYHLADQLNRATSLPDVYAAALDAILLAVKCDRASILLYDNSSVMRFVGWRGLSESYRDAVEGHSPWKQNEPSPQPITIPDITRADLDDQVKAALTKEGIRALAFIPLVSKGRLIGKFMTYCNCPHESTADELDISVTLARQLASGIERKRSEEALRESDKELTEFFENASEAILWVGADGTILRANRAQLQMLGYAAEEFIGRNIVKFHVNRRAIKDTLSRLANGEVLAAYSARMRRKDGAIRNVLINSNAYFEDGSFIHARFFTRDVTEELVIEKTLRHFAAIVESTDDVVISKDLNGIITSWNPAAQRLYGYTFEEVVGRPISILIPPDRPDEEPLILERLRRGERIDHYETIRMAKDGRSIHVSLTVSPIFDAQGRVIGASKIARDITEQKRSEEAITRLLAGERAARKDAEIANRAKDEFLAVLSHELRTPLTAILGWLSILRGQKLDKTTTRHAIETIERNAKAQAQLIEDLVDISRIVGGKLNLEFRSIDLLPVINAAVEVVRPAADAKHVKLEIKYDSKVGTVSGDATRLQQVIWNLLSNAVKFTPKGGAITVEARPADGFAEVIIRDTGIGISPDFLPHVFERFRQAESAVTRSHRGMGLGLAIVHHLVELHGGTVTAGSEGENRGSTFTVRLPLAEATSRALSRTKFMVDHEDISLEGVRILLVEDEVDARELIALALRGSGADVEAVESASNALDRMTVFNPDVLLSDIGLPLQSGYDLIRDIRALPTAHNNVPAIALTAFATENDRQLSLSAGFHAHLTKPVDPKHLIKVIRRLVPNGMNGSPKRK
jgi:PAS domain S-box-containing protein